MKNSLSFDKCVRAEFALIGLIVCFTVLGMGQAVSLCFMISFIVLLLYAAKRALFEKFSLTVVFLTMLAFFNVLVNALMSSETIWGFDYFKKVFIFISFILFLHFSYNDPVNGKTIEMVMIIPCIAGILLIISYYFLGNTATYARGITLNFSNPNFTGMWLLHIAIYMFIFMTDSERNPLCRIVVAASFFITSWLIVLTLARSCLFGLILFVLLCLARKTFHIEFARKSSFILLIVLFPIIFVAVYLGIVEAEWFNEMFSFMVSPGKSLTSRKYIWGRAIEALSNHFVLGNYSGASNGTGMAQMHNMELDVLVSYGLLPFCLFLDVLNYACKKTARVALQDKQYYALCGFLAIIVVGVFEAGIVAGAMGLNFLTAGLLVLANAERQSNTVKTQEK